VEVQITTCSVVRRRTLRRQQRTALIKDLLHDLDIVEARLSYAQAIKDKQQEAAYQKLFDILYDTYCKAIDSEV
jgi:hypothetical protein